MIPSSTARDVGDTCNVSTLATAGFVALGGAAGALLRWGTGEAVIATAGKAFVPWATLLVNVVGCALIGWIAARSGRDDAGAVGWLVANRPLLVTGLCGALTTFSTFGLEVTRLFEARRPAWALGLIALHLVLGLAAVAVGARLAGVDSGS